MRGAHGTVVVAAFVLGLAVACGTSSDADSPGSTIVDGADAGEDVVVDSAPAIDGSLFPGKEKKDAGDAAAAPTYCTPLGAKELCDDFEHDGSSQWSWGFGQNTISITIVRLLNLNHVLRATVTQDITVDGRATRQKIIGARPASTKASFAVAVRNVGAADVIEIAGFHLMNPLTVYGTGHHASIRVKDGLLELYDSDFDAVPVSLGAAPSSLVRVELTLDATDISAKRLDTGAEGKLAFTADINDTNEVRFEAGIYYTKKATAGAEVDIDDLWLEY